MTAFPTPSLGSPAARFLTDLSHTLKVSEHRLYPFIRFQEDLFLDGIDVQLLVAELESRHGHFLSEEEARRVETVGDLQRLFLRQMA